MPPPPEERKTLPHDLSRWKQGDWDYDPERDEPWEDPKIWRRHIGTPEELEAVADAIVQRYDITDTDPHGNERIIVGAVVVPEHSKDLGHAIREHVAVEHLRGLINAVQTHQRVRLARVESEEDEDSNIRVTRRWITDRGGTEIPGTTTPTKLYLWQSVVLDTYDQGEGVCGLQISCDLRLTARFDGDATFDDTRFIACASFQGSRFTGRSSFYQTQFFDYASFVFASFSNFASFERTRFAAPASFGRTRFSLGTSFDLVRFAARSSFNLAEFAAECSFDGTRFAAQASFEQCYFVADVSFGAVHFVSVVTFVRAVFAGNAAFGNARFSGTADFGSARFAGQASFWNTRFTYIADFQKARFTDHTAFGHASFADHANFSLVRFSAHADFGYAKFASDSSFGSARFTAYAGFPHASFANDVDFRHTRFAAGSKLVATLVASKAVRPQGERNGTLLRLCNEYPNGLMSFAHAEFVGDVDFSGSRVWDNTALEFVSARFAGRIRFDDPGVRDTPDRRRPRRLPMIRGSIFFTDATLDERLTFENTRFGPDARLGFDNFLARGGATVELTAEQLRLRPPINIMQGGDSNDPVEIETAADDYELLAANFARQPATDTEEDGCRWMAHELRRRASWRRTCNALRDFMLAPFDRKDVPFLARRNEGPLTWYLEYFAVIWSCIAAYAVFAYGTIKHWVWQWLIQRTAIGYLLQMHRIIVTGFFLLTVCAVIYGVGASDDTLSFNHEDLTVPSGLQERTIFGIFFSLTTFVTLGYGDYAPTGWFKLVTGLEAFFGVTLLALFTVAWGRKMVR